MPANVADIRGLLSEGAKGAVMPEFGGEGRPWFIDFAGGSPDADYFPADDFVRLTEKVLRTDRYGAVNYGGGSGNDLSYGYGGLRDALAEWSLREDGKRLDRNGVTLTSGGSHGISLVFAAFLSPGDAAIVEEPTWNYVLRDVKMAGAKCVTVPLDRDGMVLERLEERLEELRREGTRPKLLYTIANFNTPTGISLSLERRKRLVALAQKWNFVVLEDDVYGETRYEGQATPSLFSLDDSGLVLKLKSFSKFLAPSLRTGWVLGHPEAIGAVTRMRRDLGNSQLIARVLAAWLGEGHLEPLLKRVMPLYRAKRDKMRAALAEYCAPYVTWNNPDGGFFLWLQFAEGVNIEKLRKLTAEKGIRGRPGEAFYAEQTRGAGSMRAAFSRASYNDIERGIAALGEALAESAK